MDLIRGKVSTFKSRIGRNGTPVGTLAQPAAAELSQNLAALQELNEDSSPFCTRTVESEKPITQRRIRKPDQGFGSQRPGAPPLQPR